MTKHQLKQNLEKSNPKEGCCKKCKNKTPENNWPIHVCPCHQPPDKVTMTCLSLDCPERKSLCCGEGCTNGNKGEPHFVCRKCRKEYQGGECDAFERINKSPDKANFLQVGQLIECGKSHKGKNNPAWKGGRVKSSHGYILIHQPNHPNCNKAGYIYEHRLLIEDLVNRYLNYRETIHHINGNKSDNRIENLILCKNNVEHRRYDRGWTKRDNKWFKICPDCKVEIEVNKVNFTERKTNKLKGNFLHRCKRCCQKYLTLWKENHPKYWLNYKKYGN